LTRFTDIVGSTERVARLEHRARPRRRSGLRFEDRGEHELKGIAERSGSSQ
jgi:hypothetical protein